MKIALYVPFWPPGTSPNGIVTYASHIVPALRHRGHEVFVLTPQCKSTADDRYAIDLRNFLTARTLLDRVLTKLMPDSTAYRSMSTAIASAVRDLHARHRIEIFEIEESFGWSLAVSRLNLLPVVVRLHGPWFLNGQFDRGPKTAAAAQRRMRREGIAVSEATAITAPSKDALDATAQFYGFRFGLSKVIPNSVAAAEPGLLWNPQSADRNVVLFIGRFDRHKGADILLLAFAQLARKFPALRLWFVGPDIGLTNPAGDVQKLHEFMSSSSFDHVRSRIKYLGQLNSTAIAKLRGQAFVTIVSSRYETFGIAVIEAMASGCPLVATAAGGIREIVQDGRNGILVRAEDPGSIAHACSKLLEDPALAAQLGKQALQDSRDRYNPQIHADETAAFYQDAINLFRASLPS